MTLEQQMYGQGFEKCHRCLTLRPEKALRKTGATAQVCDDEGWCSAVVMAEVISFPKGGGK